MSRFQLTQDEVDHLLGIDKRLVRWDALTLPEKGQNESEQVEALYEGEKFLLDIYFARKNPRKYKYQLRMWNTILLLRLDVEGKLHKNSTCELLPRSHLHRYFEGPRISIAEVVRHHAFPDISDPVQTLEDFMRFCNIDSPPIQRGLA